MRVLLALDESECSRKAIESVRRMTWPSGTEFLVLSVAPTRFLLSAEYYVDSMDIDAAEKAALVAHEKVATDGQRVLEGVSGPVRRVVRTGDPRIVILEVAQSEDVDMIVIGSHGRTGLARLFLGSVAAHVVTHAPCNVLVVREPRPT
ncbi:MAG TPA: universal stress protein [Candidatus Eisenbacteria bacterium]